jgi:RNA methyltransferase, TrmH family
LISRPTEKMHMKIPEIISTGNPLVKRILRLQQKLAERKSSGLFVVEGRREVSLALRSGVRVAHLLVCPEIYTADAAYPVDLDEAAGRTLVEVSRAAYNKLAYRENKEGILLVAGKQLPGLDQIILKPDPLVLVLEALEKPGNLGAILRTADAAGMDAVLICDPGTDVFNPNVIRSSLGCVFTVPISVCKPAEATDWIRRLPAGPSGKKPKILAAALQKASDYYLEDLSGPTALVFGAEDKGLSDYWREHADALVRIPMSGSIDSLNVSVSVAILAFDAVRQRRTGK